MEDVAVTLNLLSAEPDDSLFQKWFGKFKEEMEKIHGKYAKKCEDNGLTPSRNPMISGWQTWDTPDHDGFMTKLRFSQMQLKAFCCKLQESLTIQYKGRFDFNNLPSDKESYYQSVSMINQLCEDPAALALFQRSFQKFDAKGMTFTLCGAGSSKVHVNKYILGHAKLKRHGNGKPVNQGDLKREKQRLISWGKDLDARARDLERQRTFKRDASKDVSYDGDKIELKTLLLEQHEQGRTLGIGSTITCGKGKGGFMRGTRKRYTGQTGIVLNVDTTFKLKQPVLVHWDGSTSTKKGEEIGDYTDWTNCLVTKIEPPQRRRRRMAQREFSDRRDSPVMTRLLEEIVAAQDNQDD